MRTQLTIFVDLYTLIGNDPRLGIADQVIGDAPRVDRWRHALGRLVLQRERLALVQISFLLNNGTMAVRVEHSTLEERHVGHRRTVAVGRQTLVEALVERRQLSDAH